MVYSEAEQVDDTLVYSIHHLTACVVALTIDSGEALSMLLHSLNVSEKERANHYLFFSKALQQFSYVI